MSSIPGYELEDFVAWQFDLVVEEQSDPNASLRIAEALGRGTPRPRLTKEQFAPILALYEPYREEVERWLSWFDSECQSWRDYACCSDTYVPQAVQDQASELAKQICEELKK